MKVIAATKNENKLREFREILPMLEIISQEEAGIDIDVEETGVTFEENSLLKAEAIFKKTGIAALADDSGLEVAALRNAPGIFSARYGGEGLDDNDRVELLLKNMEKVPKEKRTARFVCAITLYTAEGIITSKGICNGEINYAPAGKNGFGYDPVFYVKEFGKTTAQLSSEEKNAISHRGKALRELAKKLGM